MSSRRVSKGRIDGDGCRVKMRRMNESQDAMIVSSETLDRWEHELKELTSDGRAAMSERLQRAREFGDIRENADYDAARDEQAMMEARIRHLQHMIKNAIVQTSPATTDLAGPGIIVTILEDGEADVEEYLLASTAEEKVAGVRTITTSSPLGSALLGKKVGQTAEVAAPGGKFSVEVKALRPR
jgi:transcription elongation factor GreA